MSGLEEFKCDVCGKPATHLVRDLIRVGQSPNLAIELYETGELKAGCADHPQRSEEVDLMSGTEAG